MQIKCIKSITPKSEYFQEILLTDGENMFYNSKNNKLILSIIPMLRKFVVNRNIVGIY